MNTEARLRHKMLVDTAADAILSINSRREIELWNCGAQLLFGYEAAEIIGAPLSILWGGGAAAATEIEWLVATASAEGFLRGHETTCRDSSGHRMDVELTATPFHYHSGDGDGQSSGMSMVLRDVTLRRRRDEEGRRRAVDLHRQAAEHARELAENIRRLAQANVELTKLDETRSEFVSLVSHQIRAPLTNVAGAVERMQTDCTAANPTCRRMFAIIDQQVARLDHLLQDVLNTARIEAGELFLQVEPVSVLPVLQHTIEQLRARAATRPIHLVDKPGLPLVYADRDRMAEILTNLLDNADKYSPPDRRIVVEARADEREVTVAVKDSGPGLPPEDLDRVFEKYYRADSTDAQAAYGYGLGLYICRRLVEAQNGHIRAENNPGGGAVFSFSLPVWQG